MERIDELTEAYLDGALDAAEAAELRGLVEAEPEARERFAATVRFSVRLGASLHRPGIALGERVAALLATAGDGARVAAAVVSRFPTTRLVVAGRKRRWTAPSRAWQVALIALAALLLITLGLTWHRMARSTGAEASGRAVAAGDHLRGRQDLRFLDGSIIALENGSELELVALAPKRLRLVAGAIEASVARQPAGAPLVIATAHAEATVVGTEFRLEVDGTTTRLAVSEGLVRFASATAVLDVAAGRIVEAGADGTLAFVVPAAPVPAPAAPSVSMTGRLEPGGGRPFRAASPWNTPVAAAPELDAQSAVIAGNLSTAAAERDAGVALALYRYAIPVYETDAATPSRQVTCTEPWGPFPFAGFEVRVPDDARGNSGEESLLVIDWQARRTWEFWHFAWDGRAIRCAWGGQIPLDGDGTEPPSPGNAGGSLLAGLIRVREITAGRIPHVLAFGSSCAGSGFRFPAYQSDGTESGPGALPVGARIQLDPALVIDAIPGITAGERIIARSLQEYGAICVGRSDQRLLFFAELARDASDGRHPGAAYLAAGFEGDGFSMPHIPWGALRVLK